MLYGTKLATPGERLLLSNYFYTALSLTTAIDLDKALCIICLPSATNKVLTPPTFDRHTQSRGLFMPYRGWHRRGNKKARRDHGKEKEKKRSFHFFPLPIIHRAPTIFFFLVGRAVVYGNSVSPYRAFSVT